MMNVYVFMEDIDTTIKIIKILKKSLISRLKNAQILMLQVVIFACLLLNPRNNSDKYIYNYNNNDSSTLPDYVALL